VSDEGKKSHRLTELVEALARMKLAEMLEKELHDNNEKKLYEFTGKKPVKELAKMTEFSVGKISGLWQEWATKGLLVKDGKSYRKLFEEGNEDE
jgi:hypothetical protein